VEKPFDPLLEQECARLRRELERAVTRVCPRWLTAQADDIVQVALIRVIDAHRRRAGPEPLSTF
jgi:DNA-directed RNA polymerase specialized sigma24 family protein